MGLSRTQPPPLQHAQQTVGCLMVIVPQPADMPAIRKVAANKVIIHENNILRTFAWLLCHVDHFHCIPENSYILLSHFSDQWSHLPRITYLWVLFIIYIGITVTASVSHQWYGYLLFLCATLLYTCHTAFSNVNCRWHQDVKEWKITSTDLILCFRRVQNTGMLQKLQWL